MEQKVKKLDAGKITSERLRFRCWSQDDIEVVHAMNSNPEVMRYFPSIMSREESKFFIERVQARYDIDPYCWYAAELKKTGEVIGMIGLAMARFQAHFTPCTEVGWRLLPQFWGKGYATEGAQSLIGAAFTFGVEEIYSFTPVINKPSEQVMRRSGMKKIGEFDHPIISRESPLKRHVLYRIEKGLDLLL